VERGGWESTFSTSHSQRPASQPPTFLSRRITAALSRLLHPHASKRHTLYQRGKPVCQPPTNAKMPQTAGINLYSHCSFGALHHNLTHKQHSTQIPLASKDTFCTRHTLDNTNRHTHTRLPNEPQVGRIASFRSVVCKRRASKHALLRSLCPVGVMPCHQRASSASDLLGC